MFRKTEPNDRAKDTTPTPQDQDKVRIKTLKDAPSASVSNARSVSYIGPDVHFTGVLTAQEGLVIEGFFEGRLVQENRSLTVGKQGRINGQVEAREIDVRGRIEGDVYAKERIRLYAGCEVTGTIYCKKISTEEGAIFNGTVDMSLEEIRPDSATLELAANSEAPAKAKSA